MLWITENIGTIIVGTVLLLLVALIIRSMVRDKKEGKSSCGGGCGSCAASGVCHSPKKRNK